MYYPDTNQNPKFTQLIVIIAPPPAINFPHYAVPFPSPNKSNSFPIAVPFPAAPALSPHASLPPAPAIALNTLPKTCHKGTEPPHYLSYWLCLSANPPPVLRSYLNTPSIASHCACASLHLSLDLGRRHLEWSRQKISRLDTTIYSVFS